MRFSCFQSVRHRRIIGIKMDGFFENREWFAVAAGILLAAAALGCVSALRSRGREPAARERLGVALLTGLGWVLLSFALFVRGSESGRLPVANPFEIFQTLGWFAVFFAAVLRFVWSLRVPAFFAAGAAGALCALGFANVGLWDATPPPASAFLAGTPWAAAHACFATVGFACFSAAGVVWCLYLLQHSALRRKRTHPFFSRLPDLASLDRISGRLCSAGVAVFGAGAALGAAILLGGGRLGSTLAAYKTAFSCALFLGFLGLTLLRRRNGISAPKFARAGLALLLAGVVFLGGIACVRAAAEKSDGRGPEAPNAAEEAQVSR